MYVGVEGTGDEEEDTEDNDGHDDTTEGKICFLKSLSPVQTSNFP